MSKASSDPYWTNCVFMVSVEMCVVPESELNPRQGRENLSRGREMEVGTVMTDAVHHHHDTTTGADQVVSLSIPTMSVTNVGRLVITPMTAKEVAVALDAGNY